ncbi:MAG TPA: hypothetical protein PLL10_11085, partial [Elusimicrobiales bacterium]|nr:hypothetical protein [Elusimicrobiales bacterium]
MGKKLTIQLCLVLAAALTAACLRPPGGKIDANTLVVWEQEDGFIAPFLDSVFNNFKKLPGNEKVRI